MGILRAMGCPVDDPPRSSRAAVYRLETALARRFLPPLAAARGPRIGVDINVTARDFGSTLVWRVTFEDGTSREGTTSTADCREVWRGEVDGSWITRRHFQLPVDLPPGYHELEVRIGAAAPEVCALISAPPQCYEPPAIVDGGRLWGAAVQLYTLRSRENWGIGDFNDLAAVDSVGGVARRWVHRLESAACAGAGGRLARSSPYSASSRHFLNVLYIAVPVVPEFAECLAANERLRDPQVAHRLRQLRDRDLVDYGGVADLKFEILELLYRDFSARHATQDTDRGRRFRAFVAAGGDLLQMHARFDALDRYFRATQDRASGWLNWPEEYRDVNGRAAERFAREHPAEVEFYAYLQWLAHEQLCDAQTLARELGMPIGLYGDYAVGANPSGSETWADRDSYCMGAEIGAPPDPLALKGQGWGIPPQDPAVMEAQRLQGFVRLIRNNMRYYGALRLDHVMSLFRLWWVPAGHSPTDGAYVHYPFHQLLSVLALESARGACLVVGEDLGVVPDEMRRAMPEFGLYHYKVLLFEKLEGRFRRPDEYARCALATVTTHDMPTLRSYWEGRDIDLRRGLSLYPSLEIDHEMARQRVVDREWLQVALREQGLLSQPVGDEFTPRSRKHCIFIWRVRNRHWWRCKSKSRGHGRSCQRAWNRP